MSDSDLFVRLERMQLKERIGLYWEDLINATLKILGNSLNILGISPNPLSVFPTTLRYIWEEVD